jgi:hypothetical protein
LDERGQTSSCDFLTQGCELGFCLENSESFHGLNQPHG